MATKLSLKIVVTLFAAFAATAGCSPSSSADFSGAFPIARERKVRPRTEYAIPMRPRTPAPDVPSAAAPTTLALAPNVSVDARLLIITADGTDAAFDAIRETIGYLGTPYDVLNAATDTLTAGTLADGDHGKYQAIFLDVGDLYESDGSAFTNDEWMTLIAYEARF
ncbi:MAG TPA: hypothetical protein VN903_25275, partial [Polyangia bacterium]|nr:hypothetical protein [Polyangia bacterium]